MTGSLQSIIYTQQSAGPSGYRLRLAIAHAIQGIARGSALLAVVKEQRCEPEKRCGFSRRA